MLRLMKENVGLDWEAAQYEVHTSDLLAFWQDSMLFPRLWA